MPWRGCHVFREDYCTVARDSKCHSFSLSVAFCVDQCTFIHRSRTKINTTTTAVALNDQKIKVDSLTSPAAVWVNDSTSDYYADLCCPTKTWLCHDKYLVLNGSTPPCHINTNITQGTSWEGGVAAHRSINQSKNLNSMIPHLKALFLVFHTHSENATAKHICYCVSLSWPIILSVALYAWVFLKIRQY